MKTKKKIWCCLFSLLWIFVLIFPVMASDIPERRMRLRLLQSILWKEKQPRHMQMITMIIMAMAMEKTMMAFCFW